MRHIVRTLTWMPVAAATRVQTFSNLLSAEGAPGLGAPHVLQHPTGVSGPRHEAWEQVGRSCGSGGAPS
jgi:hypothetical protein